jgi:hypothetical protein
MKLGQQSRSYRLRLFALPDAVAHREQTDDG